MSILTPEKVLERYSDMTKPILKELRNRIAKLIAKDETIIKLGLRQVVRLDISMDEYNIITEMTKELSLIGYKAYSCGDGGHRVLFIHIKNMYFRQKKKTLNKIENNKV